MKGLGWRGNQRSPGLETLEERRLLTAASAENLAIVELNYNPRVPTPDELAVDPTLFDDQFEFIELLNTGDDTIDMSGVHFTAGIGFAFDDASRREFQPGERFVVARDLTAFAIRYGDQAGAVGQFSSGGLSNGGEQLVLLDALGRTIANFSYDDSADWPQLADGIGSSLELIDPLGNYNSPDNWRDSTEIDGTPGAAGSGQHFGIVINEILSHTDPPQSDSIELFNVTDQAIDISGWYLSDSASHFEKFRIPAGSVVSAHGYIVFDESDFNASGSTEPGDFALNGAHGDDVWLLRTDATGRVSHFVDNVYFGAQTNGESWGRWPNGQGILYPMLSLTLGASNAGPRIGPLLISEVMYNPSAVLAIPDDFEYVEVYNSTTSAVGLAKWGLRGVDFDFGLGQVIGPGQAIVVVSFDPSDPFAVDKLNAFQQEYNLDNSTIILGPYQGRLGNGDEEIRLVFPDEPPSNEPGFYPELLEDAVHYYDTKPWPESADGHGLSLTRNLPADWGHDAASWVGAPPTPGMATQGPRVKSLILNDLTDPPDLPSGTQPATWNIQRSDWRNVVIQFSTPVQLTPADVRLTNLGPSDGDEDDFDIALDASQFHVNADVLAISFAANELPDGSYSLTLLPTITSNAGLPLDGNADGVPGDAYVYSDNRENRFFKLTADLNGDGGVSIFDFPTFRYWFGLASGADGPAPEYVDLNADGGVSIFDFSVFAANFGAAHIYQTLAADQTPGQTGLDPAIVLPQVPLAARQARIAVASPPQSCGKDNNARERSGTTDANGIFRRQWVRNLNNGDYHAHAIDLYFANDSWSPLDLGSEDHSGGDGGPDDSPPI